MSTISSVRYDPVGAGGVGVSYILITNNTDKWRTVWVTFHQGITGAETLMTKQFSLGPNTQISDTSVGLFGNAANTTIPSLVRVRTTSPNVSVAHVIETGDKKVHLRVNAGGAGALELSATHVRDDDDYFTVLSVSNLDLSQASRTATFVWTSDDGKQTLSVQKTIDKNETYSASVKTIFNRTSMPTTQGNVVVTMSGGTAEGTVFSGPTAQAAGGGSKLTNMTVPDTDPED